MKYLGTLIKGAAGGAGAYVGEKIYNWYKN
ncbi:hypothetical protein ICM_06580 [Bacillus cereus BAG1X2-3]|nr:hypothetical protein ICC_06607 [Bacillus cereus BAG1X1-1]EOO42364.1 hypothetical protein ICI_06593 [Bacillus cereus BAG1X2-1]EOO43524.1 hypothetical protein ICK_06911 [Bacillus cereus BAG1X2-2]EOO55540.1 hypothetical protein ICM_06580 [Bacillus cereus BAG1X2-3]EOO99837.1 hypothetical protein ICO_06756 [Bacillus cereus BAG2O-1]